MPTDTPPPARPVTLGVVLDGLLAVGVVALGFLLAACAVRQSDYFLRLATGRLVSEGAYPFGRDPFGFSSDGLVWRYPAWLFDTLVYQLHTRSGVGTVVAVKALAVAAAAGFMLALRRRGSGFGWPAFGTALALVACGRNLTVRPTVAAMALFAALLWLLHRPAKPAWRWLLGVAVVQALWANLDGSFLLGPIAILVWLIGALLGQVVRLGGGDADEPDHPPALLATALGVALVASCLNPYGPALLVTPPSEWTVPAVAADEHNDPLVGLQFVQPLAFTKYAEVAGRPATIALVALAAFGIAAFAVNVGGWRWGGLFLWFALGFYAATRFSAVPLFAVWAGPALARNAQAWLSRQRWAADANAAVGLLGRTGTLLFVAALLFAAVGPGNVHPAQKEGVSFALEPNAHLQRQAEQIGRWTAAGQLDPATDRGYFLQPDLAHYCAWFAPSTRSLIDTRLVGADNLRDHLAIRRLLSGLRTAPALTRPAGLDALLRQHGITYMVIGGTERFDHLAIEPHLWPYPGDYPVWAVAGRGVIHGVRGGGATRSPLPLDLPALAFRTEATPPAGVTPEMLRLPTAAERFPAKPAGPDAAEAVYFVTYADWLRGEPARVNELVSIWATTAVIGLEAGAATGPVPCNPAALIQLAMQADGAMARVAGRPRVTADDALAAPLLAIRAARRAIAGEPDHPEPYRVLAQAYTLFPGPANVRRLQQTVALRQSLARLPNLSERADAMALAPLEYQAAFQLAGVFEQSRRQLDLTLAAAKLAADRFPDVLAERGITGEQATQAMKQNQARLQQLEAFVKRQRDGYELEAAKAPPEQRPLVALRFGLPDEALRELRKMTGSKFSGELIPLLIELELLAGHAEAAYGYLQLEPINPVENAPEPFRPQLHSLRLQTALAMGDTATARAELDRALTQAVEDVTAARGPVPVAVVVGTLITPADPLAKSLMMPFWGDAVGGQRVAQVRLADAHLQRGVAALEAGDMRAARFHLGLAASTWPPGYEGGILAKRFLTAVGK